MALVWLRVLAITLASCLLSVAKMDVSIPEMQDLVWYVTIWSIVLKLMENN